MTHILKTICWNLKRNSLEAKIMNYCRIEFRPYDVESAFIETMKQQKALYMGAK